MYVLCMYVRTYVCACICVCMYACVCLCVYNIQNIDYEKERI